MPTPSSPSELEPRTPTRVNPMLLGALLVLLVLVAALGGYGWSLGRLVDDSLPRMADSFPPESGRPPISAANTAGDAPLNVLFLGSDRVPQNAADPGYSADTVLLVHIDADRTRADVIALPGDAQVTLPEVGRDRISAATTRGGVPMAVATVERLLQVRVDHVVVMDLNGVQEMTDALGGVEVDVPHPFRTPTRDFAAGRQVLDGEAALAFVREQRSLPGRQQERISNQSLYVHALVDELISHGTLTDPDRLQNFLLAVTDSTSVDDGLTGARIRQLAVELRALRPSDARVRSLPVAQWQVDAQRPTVVELDPAGMAQLRSCLAADDFTGCP